MDELRVIDRGRTSPAIGFTEPRSAASAPPRWPRCLSSEDWIPDENGLRCARTRHTRSGETRIVGEVRRKASKEQARDAAAVRGDVVR